MAIPRILIRFAHEYISCKIGGLLSETRKKFVNFVSKKSFLKGWYGFIVFFFALFVIIPTVFVISYIFTDWSAVSSVLSDPGKVSIIISAVIFSFEIATIVTIIDFIMGLPLAWMLVRKKFRGKKFLNTLIDIPLVVPTGAAGFSIALFWAITPGVSALGSLRLISSPFLLIMLLHIVFSYPYMVRSLAAILEEIDVTYDIAAQTCSASPLTAARTITLPLFKAGLITGTILCFARSLSETGGTMIALSMIGTSIKTGPVLVGVWKKESLTNPQLVPALAFVSILLIVLAIILLIIVKLVIMKVKLPFRKVWPGPEKFLSRGITPHLKDFLSLIFLIIVILIPTFFVFGFVATPHPGVDMVWSTFFGSLGYSFLVGGVVTAIDLLLGIPMAILITRGKSKRLGHVLDALVNVPLIVPTAALGFSLGMFWNRSGINVPLVLIILAHVAFTYPLVVRCVAGAIEEIDPSFEETAHTLGAKPLQVFRRVLFPMIKSSVLAGSIIALARSLGETGATLAVSPTTVTAPVYIVNLINNKAYYQTALACIVLIIVSFIFLLLLRYTTRKER